MFSLWRWTALCDDAVRAFWLRTWCYQGSLAAIGGCCSTDLWGIMYSPFSCLCGASVASIGSVLLVCGENANLMIAGAVSMVFSSVLLLTFLIYKLRFASSLKKTKGTHKPRQQKMNCRYMQAEKTCDCKTPEVVWNFPETYAGA